MEVRRKNQAVLPFADGEIAAARRAVAFPLPPWERRTDGRPPREVLGMQIELGSGGFAPYVALREGGTAARPFLTARRTKPPPVPHSASDPPQRLFLAADRKKAGRSRSPRECREHPKEAPDIPCGTDAPEWRTTKQRRLETFLPEPSVPWFPDPIDERRTASRPDPAPSIGLRAKWAGNEENHPPTTCRRAFHTQGSGHRNTGYSNP